MASVKIRNRLGQWIDLILDNVASDSIYQALSARQGKLLAQGKADKATTLSGYGIADAYTKTEIDALIASVFKYKGVKATYADVEAVQNPSVGDVWFVTADGSEYAWNGTVWEKLGPVIDLSHFLTSLSIAGITLDVSNTTITSAQLIQALNIYTKSEVYNKTEVDTLLAGKVPTSRKVNGHALDQDVTVSKSDVGLGNVDNTPDTDKPVSTAQQTALNGKADKATTLSGYGITNAYTKTEIDALISAVFKYKGVKATLADVEAVVDPRIGDVWFVTADSSEYAWNGTAWEKLGPIIDLSHFITQISIAGLTIDAQSTTITKDQLLTALGVYTKAEVDTMKEEVDEHLENVDSAISTDTETVTGNPVTVETQSAQIAEKTVIKLEPKQDLHGYDHPWAGGSGKNKLDITLSTRTTNGITFTNNGDGTITLNGEATAYTFFNLNYAKDTKSIPTGSYIFSGMISGIITRVYQDNIKILDYGGTTEQPFEISSESVVTTARIDIATGTTFDNVVYRPMIRLATETDPTFEPYSNICPITGWTGAKVTRTGKNLLDVSKNTNGYVISGTGVVTELSVGTYSELIPVAVGEIYMFTAISGLGSLHWMRRIVGYDSSGTYSRVLTDTGNDNFPVGTEYTITATIPSGIAYIRVSYDKNATDAKFKNVTVYPITFPSEAGTVYGGTLTVNKDGSGELVVDRACVEISPDWEWRADTSYTNYAFYGFSSNIPIPKNNNWTSLTNIVCDRYVADKASDIDRGVKDATISEVTHQNGTRIWICDKRFTSVSDFKASLTGAKCVYEIATPVSYALTAPQVKTLLGVNNIWADTGDVELTFRKGAFATLEDVHDIIESSEDASIYHLGFCIKDGKLCQIYSKEEE